jgi:plasmid stabilization system protein ParE
MGKRKVSILEPAVSSVAEIAMFIESKGLPQTAKKFVDEAFAFFEKLSDDRIIHKPCTHSTFKWLDYRCITYKKKYVVAYLRLVDEIVICDFVSAKLLK